MKFRFGFVSNSSSTSFIIENKTKERIHLCEFIRENPQLITQWETEFDNQIIGKEITQSHTGKTTKITSLDQLLDIMCQEAREKERSEVKVRKSRALAPGENVIQFGDEEGTILGEIYDYVLRDGGESKRFRWRFNFYNR